MAQAPPGTNIRLKKQAEYLVKLISLEHDQRKHFMPNVMQKSVALKKKKIRNDT